MHAESGTAVSTEQLHLLHHTLGLRPDRREPWRNHFVASNGHHDMPNLEALQAIGLMERARTPAFCDKEDIVFMVTDAGRELALDQLPPEPKRTRYEEYQHSEYSGTFSEWLGINKPKYEFRGPCARTEYRMYRHSYVDGWLYGEWAPTMKDAKASYKAALKAKSRAA